MGNEKTQTSKPTQPSRPQQGGQQGGQHSGQQSSTEQHRSKGPSGSPAQKRGQ